MDNVPNICRLCLNFIGKDVSYAPLQKNNAVLQSLNLISFSTIKNLQLTKNPVICESCNKKLTELATFKENIIANEFKIQCNKKNDPKSFLHSISKDVNKICRLCLKVPDNLKDLSMSWKESKILLHNCNIHLNKDIANPSKICSNCDSSLKKLGKFIVECTYNEKKIFNFASKKGMLDSTHLIELFKIGHRRQDSNDNQSDETSEKSNKEDNNNIHTDTDSLPIRRGLKLRSSPKEKSAMEGYSSGKRNCLRNKTNKGDVKEHRKCNNDNEKRCDDKLINQKAYKTYGSANSSISGLICDSEKELILKEISQKISVSTKSIDVEVINVGDVTLRSEYDYNAADNGLQDLTDILDGQNDYSLYDDTSETDMYVEECSDDFIIMNIQLPLDISNLSENEDTESNHFNGEIEIELDISDISYKTISEKNNSNNRQQSKITSTENMYQERDSNFKNNDENLPIQTVISSSAAQSFIQNVKVKRKRKNSENGKVQDELNAKIKIQKLDTFDNNSRQEVKKNEAKSPKKKVYSNNKSILTKKTQTGAENVKLQEQEKAKLEKKDSMKNVSNMDISENKNTILSSEKDETRDDKNLSKEEQKLIVGNMNTSKIPKKRGRPPKKRGRPPNKDKIINKSSELSADSNVHSSPKHDLTTVQGQSSNSSKLSENSSSSSSTNTESNNDNINPINENQTVEKPFEVTIIRRNKRTANRAELDKTWKKLTGKSGHQSKVKEENPVKILKKRGRRPNPNKVAPVKPEYLICGCCSFKTTSQNSFIQHQYIHTVMDNVAFYKCTQCLYKTSNQELFKQHEATHSVATLNYKCIFCDYYNKKKISIMNHILRHDDKDVGNMFYCVVVNEESMDEFFECFQCDYQNSEEAVMPDHVIDHNRTVTIKNPLVAKFVCNLCTYRTKSEERLQRHIELKHARKKKSVVKEENVKPNNVPEDGVYKCDLCAYMTLQRKSLGNHKNRKHFGKPSERKETGETFYCAECPYTTHRKPNLARHALVHKTKDNMEFYECTHCYFETKHRRSYTRHMEVRHKVIV